MKAGKYLSGYLRATDVKDPTKVTITKVIEEEVGKEESAEDKLVAYFKELEQGLILNKTVINFLVENTASDETEDWVGKTYTLFNDPNVFYSGKRVGGLRLRVS